MIEIDTLQVAAVINNARTLARATAHSKRRSDHLPSDYSVARSNLMGELNMSENIALELANLFASADPGFVHDGFLAACGMKGHL